MTSMAANHLGALGAGSPNGVQLAGRHENLDGVRIEAE